MIRASTLAVTSCRSAAASSRTPSRRSCARLALLHVPEVAGRHRVLARNQQGVQLEERLVAQVGMSPATEPARRARQHGISLSPGPARCRTPGRRPAGVAADAAHGTGAPGSWSPASPVTSLTSRVVAPSIWLSSTTVRCRSGNRSMAPISRSPRSRRSARASGDRVSRHRHPLQRAGVARGRRRRSSSAPGGPAPSPGPGSC